MTQTTVILKNSFSDIVSVMLINMEQGRGSWQVLKLKILKQ